MRLSYRTSDSLKVKYWRAAVHYYLGQALPGLALLMASWAFIDLSWAFVLYLLLGGILGFYSFRAFYKEQLNFYYNLGFTNLKLIAVSSLINIFVLLCLGLITAVVFYLFQ